MGRWRIMPGQDDEAIPPLRAALEQFEQCDDRLEQLGAWMALGDAYCHIGQFAAAAESFQRAAMICRAFDAHTEEVSARHDSTGVSRHTVTLRKLLDPAATSSTIQPEDSKTLPPAQEVHRSIAVTGTATATGANLHMQGADPTSAQPLPHSAGEIRLPHLFIGYIESGG